MLTNAAHADGTARRSPRPALKASGTFHADFDPFAELDALVLAVSGGPDSMALLLLAADWARHVSPAPMLYVATVDHGLRLESVAEAALVARTAADLGLSHATLVWHGDKPKTRIQERARAARYAMLADHARSVGARHILTAHHADDQAETILLRLGRGSGVTGLAGMRDVSALSPEMWLARPLLRHRKADLVAICERAGCAFVDDPSNSNTRFARAKLRTRSAELEALGLGRAALGRLAHRMARADAALEAETARQEARLDPTIESGMLTCALLPLAAASPEIKLRLLGRLVGRLARSARIRLERLEDLAACLSDALDRGEPFKATIAGTILSLDRNGILLIQPEGRRRRGRGEG